ncbi:HNH endonuclease [Nitrospinae bacterium AH-259-F20]|nr:HNH endonuclease [Nitrospinae bacterium AH-259-F20]
MPRRPPRACSSPGCPALTHERFCEPHDQEDSRRRDAERGTSTERGYGARWQRLRVLVLKRQPICNLCKRKPATEVDHIKPKAAGGGDEMDNLQGLCKPCHTRKTYAEARGGRGGKSLEGSPLDRRGSLAHAAATLIKGGP